MEDLIVYEPEPDRSRATWASERIMPFQEQTLRTIVPEGFERYLRIFQPAWRFPGVDPTDKLAADIASGHYGWEHATPVRWSDVASETGSTAHRLMQWHGIKPPLLKPGKAGISEPIEYEITSEMVEALFEIFINYSGREQECLCAFWTGYGHRNPAFPESGNTIIKGIGQQEYYLFHAPLNKIRDQWASVVAERSPWHGFAPNAVWPSNQEWYYSVPIGYVTSYIGGSKQFINAIHSSEALETYEAFPKDNITRDEINTTQ